MLIVVLKKALCIMMLLGLLCTNACMHKWRRTDTLVTNEKVLKEEYLLTRTSVPTIGTPKLKVRYQKVVTRQKEQQRQYYRKQSAFMDALVWVFVAGQVMIWTGLGVAVNDNPSLGWKISLLGLGLDYATDTYGKKHAKPIFEYRPEVGRTLSDTLFLSGEDVFVSLGEGHRKIVHKTNETGEIEVYLNRYIHVAGDTNLQLSFGAPNNAKYDVVVRRDFIEQMKSQRTIKTHRAVLLDIGVNELSLLTTEKPLMEPGEYALFYNEEQKGVILIQKTTSRTKAVILEREMDFDKTYNGATFTLKSL